MNDINKSEITLQMSEELYCSFMDSSSDMLFIKDTEGRYLKANKTFLNFINLTEEALTGKTDYDFMSREVADNCKQSDRKVLEEKGLVTSIEAIGKVYYEIRKFMLPLPHGKTGIGGYIRDITERKKVEEELQKSNEKFQNIFKSFQDAFFQADLSGRFTLVSPSAVLMYGYPSLEEIIGMPAEKLYVNESDRRNLLKELDGKGIVNDFISQARRKDGTTFWVSMNVQFQYEKGEIVGTEGIVRDITERKQAEMLLINSKLKFGDIFENSIMGISEVDPSGHLINVNMAYAKMYGYESPDEILKEIKNVESLYANPEDRKEVLWTLDEKGYMHPKEIEVVKRDGTRMFVYVSAKAVKDADGKFLYYQGSHIDITQRKKAEDALRNSEQKYRLLFENSGDAVLLTNPNGEIYSANPEACKIFGRTEEEICKLGRSGIIDQKDVRLKKALEERARTGKFNGILNCLRKDGTVFQGEVNSNVFIDSQGEKRTSMIIRDITERKRVEDELLNAKMNLENFFRLVPDLIVVASTDGYFKSLNPQWEQTLGFSTEELLSKPFEYFIHPDDVIPTRKEVEKQMQGKATIRFNNRYIHKDGSYRWLEWNATPASGNLLYAAARDVTESKRADEEIRQSKDQLEMLNSYLLDIREKERAQIALEIHDELGQILTALKMDISSLLQDVGDKPEIRQKIKVMLELSSDLLKSVQNISAELRPSILDDLGLIPAIEWYGTEFENRTKIKCLLNLDAIEFKEITKNLAVFRIIQEALTNIARHSQAKNAKIRLEGIDQNIHIIIEDDGIGFSKEKLSSGNSFGLIGMKERVHQMNGIININSAINKGTKIEVKIPV